MFKHNLLLIYRGFMKSRGVFMINIVGLSTALAATMLIYLWVADEFSVDKYHENVHRIFQVMENAKHDGSINTSGHTADFLSSALAAEIPEVEHATVVTPPHFFPSFTLAAGTPIKGVGKFVDQDFFKIFTYTMVEGNSETVLLNKTDVVISESLAKNLFKETNNLIGKSIQWQVMGVTKHAVISGVFKDVPSNSSEHFDFVMPFDVFRDLMQMDGSNLNWNEAGPFFSYLLLNEDADVKALNEKLNLFLASKTSTAQHRTLFLKPYGDNYLYNNYENGLQAGGRIEYVILFSIIAIFILLIACINFMNLSTAQAFQKLKGTGVRRIIGAGPRVVIYQYLGEAFVTTLLAMSFAVVFVLLLLPQFNVMTGKTLTLVLTGEVMLALIIAIVAVTFMSGFYPAMYLSKFDPARALKGQSNASAAEVWARNGLVTFQFTLSIIFIVSVLVVYKQIEFIQNKNIGYEKQNVIHFEVEGKVSEDAGTFISEIKKIPGVVNASGMLGNIVSEKDGGGMPGSVEWEGRKVTMISAAVNFDLLELLGMQMKDGRSFSRDFPSDAGKVIFNEAAIDALGIEDPVGKIVGGKEVLGVVRDFHYQSLHESIKPYSFRLEPQSTTTIIVKLQPENEEETIRRLQAFYASYNPGFEFTYQFLDQVYRAQYEGERRVALLSQYGAVLTIVISSLGLFGLVAFTMQRREKEIGIRKVLGSTEVGVVMLLSYDFMKMVFVAICIGLPASYFISTYWLSNFAYKISLAWWHFAGAAAITFIISWLTVATQTIRAAKENPVKVLRSE